VLPRGLIGRNSVPASAVGRPRTLSTAPAALTQPTAESELQPVPHQPAANVQQPAPAEAPPALPRGLTGQQPTAAMPPTTAVKPRPAANDDAGEKTSPRLGRVPALPPKAAPPTEPTPAASKPAQTDLPEAIRASELEISFAVSDAPPASTEGSKLAARDQPPPLKATPADAIRASEIEIALSEPPAAITARPPSAQGPDASDSLVEVSTSDRPSNSETARPPANDAPPTAAPPAPTKPEPMKPIRSAARAPVDTTRGAAKLQPTMSLSVKTVVRPSTGPARTVEPVAAQATNTSATPSRAPRYPFDAAPRAAEPAVTFTGATTSRAPRHPFDAAPRTAEATGTFASATPSRAPRHPFDAAPRAETTGTFATTPSRAPRHPFDAAPRAEPAATPSAGPARAQRHPFDAAAGATGPQPSAAPPGTTRSRSPGRKRASARAVPAAVSVSSEAAAAPRAFTDVALTQAEASTPKPQQRTVWVLGAIAVIGCSALWLYRNYDSHAATAPGNPAAGALVQTPALTGVQEQPKIDTTPAVAAQPILDPPTTTTAEPSAPTQERRASSGRRAGETTEVDPTTAAGRARGLVDSGSAMLHQGRLGLAEGMYMKALQEVPEYPPAMAELVRVHIARRDGKEAVRWAELLVQKQNSGLHQLLLGDAQSLRGNSGAAQEAWNKAARAGNATARERLADAE
jgi:hypothetical protein